MKQSEAIIERVRRINPAYQHLELAVDDTLSRIKPGQSLLVKTGRDWHPYLRVQWHPVTIAGAKLVIERPAGEHYDVGQVVDVLGLVGQPIRFRRNLRNVLLVAYDTPPTPLLMTIPWLMGNKVSVTLVLLGTARQYDTAHLNPEVEVIKGDDDLNWQNQVMTVGWADQVLAVVHTDDELGRFKKLVARFEERRAIIPQNYLFGIFNGDLPCGVGACHACMLQTRQSWSLVCTDGPAFDLTQITLD
jgi:NAD(P)H-flavin reductase